MIQKKLDELEALITVPNVDKHPEQSLTAMKALNLIVELRGLVEKLDLHIVTNIGDMQKRFCTGCKKTTIHEIKEHYYQGEPGKVWQCSICHTNNAWAD